MKMSPEMLVRIAGRNDTSAAFSQVAKDAQAAGQSVKASGELAATGLRAEAQALELVGERSRAVAARSQNLLFQLNDIGVSLAGGQNPLMVIAQQGSQIAGIYGGQGGVKSLFEDIAGFATKLLPVGAVVGVIAAGFAALTTEVNRGQKEQVSFIDVVVATWQIGSQKIMGFLEPIGSWLGGVWDKVAPLIAHGVNWIIGQFDLAYRTIGDLWQGLPAALGDAVMSAAQATVNGVIWMGREAIANLNGLITHANGLLRQFNLPEIGGLGNPNKILPDVTVPNPFAGALGALNDKMAGDQAEVFKNVGTDAYTQMIGDLARKNHVASDSTDKLSGAMKAANDNAKLLAGGLKDVGGVTDLVAQSQQNMADTALGAFGQLTGGLAALFKDNKAFAIANAVINTAEGITKALAQGGIFGYIAAAGVAAAGAAQIAAIASANPGSASAPSVTQSGGAAAAAAAPVQGAGAINLTIRGSGSISVDDFAKQLAAGLADNQHPDLARQINVIRAA
jgi:hypothetical protein